MKKLTQEEFVEKAITIHKNKYDYSKVKYVNSQTKVCIICPEHGEFWQMPYSHLNGIGCPKCGVKRRSESAKLNTEDFIKRAKTIHGDKYNYSKSNYIGRHKPITITCPIHGDFIQEAGNHLCGAGCPECRRVAMSNMQKSNCEEFIKKAKAIHGDKYDYSKVEYVDSYTKVCIICPIHGEFWQRPNNHLSGLGCQKCANEHRNDNNRGTTESFIAAAKKVHGDKYDYSKVEYVDSKTKVCIICPEHGEFWQIPNNHLHGWGCSRCSESSMEREMKDFLDKNNIQNIPQKKFDWLRFEEPLILDFFLPDYNIAIECQGLQHYEPVGFGCKNKKKIFEQFEKVKKRDAIKYDLCKNNGISILYYTREANKENENTFTDKEELRKKIME